MNRTTGTLSIIMAGLLLGGCASRTQNVNPRPNENPKASRESFAAYAATREYPADLPKAETSIRAEVDYQLDVINLVNLGDSDIKNAEVWVNEHYVVLVGDLPSKRQRGVTFAALHDKSGQRAPSRGTWVQKIELNYDGAMHPVRFGPAD